MSNSSKKTPVKFNYFHFQLNDIVHLSEDNPLSKHCKIVQLGKSDSSTSYDFSDESGSKIDDYAHYGKSAGLYWLWKNTNYDYYGFSLINCMPIIEDDELQDFLKSGKDIFRIKSQNSRDTMQENYRTSFFSYDFRMMISVLKKYQQSFFTYTQDHYIDTHQYYLPVYIIKKDVFRKFCLWCFPILETCKNHLADKWSVYQNMYLEHLTYSLLAIYIGYNQKNLKIHETARMEYLNYESKAKPISILEHKNPKDYLQHLLNEGRVEEALAQYNKNIKESYPEYQKVFSKYEKERRYFKSTLLEECHNLDSLLQKECTGEREYKSDVLVIKWNSISHEETLLAFKKLGLTYESLEVGNITQIKIEDAIDRINRMLDINSYKFVFSLNFLPSVAEACYIHDTHYIAWSYDSPVTLEPKKFCEYETTHVFLFDSSETEYNKLRGLDNVFYMPLAVNVEKYDKIKCSKKDIEKYSSSISFVGRLYNNKLNEAMASLSDYQKAYLNAIIDTCSYTRNYDLLRSILSFEFLDFLSNKRFNKIVNAEWDFEKATDDTPNPGRLMLLLNKTITNRERLLIIGMLSNHWDFKLYSDTSHEVFSNTIECGTIDYYTEMPKVFKCSKINLNITLRSIATGIPLRCLDIMGCHGFLLTNHQKDFDNHFEDGKNLIFYDSADEAYDKVSYYLSHESERQKIADAGYETVKKHYNYPNIMKQVIELSGLGNVLKGK